MPENFENFDSKGSSEAEVLKQTVVRAKEIPEETKEEAKAEIS